MEDVVFLHAAGLGYGASLALDLPVKVRLLDKPSKRELSDEDNLLTSVEKSWEKFGHTLPTVEFYWSVNSKNPAAAGTQVQFGCCGGCNPCTM